MVPEAPLKEALSMADEDVTPVAADVVTVAVATALVVKEDSAP